MNKALEDSMMARTMSIANLASLFGQICLLQ